MSSSRLLPDPDKWVTTKKVERPPQQRPLVDPRFRAHCGIATPPSTGGKRKIQRAPPTSSAIKTRRLSQATPSALTRGGIESFLTPPTTTSAHLTRTTLAPLDANSRRSGRSKSPSRGDTSDFQEGMSIAAWKASIVEEKQPLKSSSVHLTSPSKVAEQLPTTPSGPSFSQRELTPVPDSVLARHKLLCGQDSVRRRAAISPWRREEGVDRYNDEAARADREAARKAKEEERLAERERKRLRLDVREAVGNSTADRIRKVKDRRVLGEFKSLIHLSSDRSSSPGRSSPSDRVPPIREPIRDQGNALRRHSSAVEGPVCARDEQWPQRQAVPLMKTSLPRRSRPALSSDDDTPKVSTRAAVSSAFPPRQPHAQRGLSPNGSKLKLNTPRKLKATHHHITPPKSRTPQHVDHGETLFVLPAPPKQPIFQPVVSQPAQETEWQPVSMEPETLMTWSLGGGGRGAVDVDDHEAPSSENDDADSIAPSIPSQSFPILVESSPEKKSPGRDEPERLSVGESSSPGSRTSLDLFAAPMPRSRESRARAPSPKKPLVRHVDTRRPEPVPKLLSSLPDVPRPESMPQRAPSKRRPTQSKDSTQTKLAAFGYFRSTPRATRDFDTSFSDEEDLDFDIEEQPAPESDLFSPGLQRVPQAPPHPSLRPSGIRMLTEREEEGMRRHRAQLADKSSCDSARSPIGPPSMSDITDASSSLPDQGPQISESTRKWWDELGAATIDDELPSL